MSHFLLVTHRQPAYKKIDLFSLECCIYENLFVPLLYKQKHLKIMAHTLTVEELAKICNMELTKGNGTKKILISSDDEGNGYHELFFAFTPTDRFNLKYVNLPYNVDEKDFKENYIVLG